MGDVRDESHRYWAFISYSHLDRSWARWLHERLERYRLPRRLIGRPHWSGTTPRRLAPIFRDRDELPSSADLGGVIQQALHQSRYLIVVCSPNAAQSRWVNEEIETFKRLGREDRVLCLKIEGASSAADCFPPALRERYDADGRPTGQLAEPLAADANRHADGRDGAALKLIAGMLGVGYDDLRQREHRRRWRNRALVATAAAALLGVITLGWHWQQLEQRAALDAQALQTRIARLYEAGRREMLDHNEARAAVLLNEARRLGAQTPAIDFLLGRAMRAVDAQRLRIDSGVPPRMLHIDAQGRRLLTFGLDQTLRVYDARSGASLYVVPFEKNLSLLTEFSAGGKVIWLDTDHVEEPRRRLSLVDAESGAVLRRLAIRPSDNTVALSPLDAEDRQFTYIDPAATLVVESLDGTQRRVQSGRYVVSRFCGRDDSVLAARADGVIEWRDAKTLRLRRQFSGLSGNPTMLYGDDRCTLLAAGSGNGAIRVWQTGDGTLSMSSGHRGPIVDLRLDGAGRRMLSVSDGHMGFWNPRGGSLLYSLENPNYFENLVAMDADGGTLVRLAEGRLAALDTESGKERLTLDDHVGGPIQFGVGANGRVVSAGADGTIAVWQVPSDPLLDLGGRSAQAKPAQTVEGTPVAFSPDGRQFASAAGAAGELWQLDPLRREHVLPGPPPQALAYSDDGSRLVSTAGDGSIRVVDTRSGAMLWERPASEQAMVAQLDRQGRRIAAVLDSGFLQIWTVDTGETLLRERFFARCGPYTACRSFAFSPRDTRFASGLNETVQMRDLDSGKRLWTRSLPLADESAPRLNLVAFSHDARHLLVTAEKRRAFVLDARDGRIVHQLDEPGSLYFSWARFSPDGQQAAIAEHGKTALIWDFTRGRIHHLRGHTGPVRTLEFSADGALLATGGLDGEIKIWDAISGDLLQSFVAHDSGIFWGGLGFSRDRRYLLSGASADSVRLWSIAAETRDAETIAAEIRCRTPWTVQDISLQPQRHNHQHCAPIADGNDAQEKTADASAGGS